MHGRRKFHALLSGGAFSVLRLLQLGSEPL
jgi:hypothetical protein